MEIWGKMPFIRYALALISGIIFQSEMNINQYYGFALLVILLILFFIQKKLLQKERWTMGITGLSMIFVAGSLLYGTESRYNVSQGQVNNSDVKAYSGTVINAPEETSGFNRAVVKVTKTLPSHSLPEKNTKVLLYAPKTVNLSYGSKIIIKGKPKPVSPPRNPAEFNYKKYLLNKGIAFQHFINKEDISVRNAGGNFILRSAYYVRKLCSETINETFSGEDAAILTALTLGDRSSLTPEVKKRFTESGTMHILAVSGMHTGIIFSALLWLLTPLRRVKMLKWLFLPALILPLWFFAFLTGFSASVQRAAVMFTVISISLTFSRNYSILNSLGIAAVVLLLLDPKQVFSTGFQFSFAAVTGIVVLYQPLYGIVKPGYIITKKIWALLTASLAAQIAVFPISLYYFHQFPVWFLLANLIAIPSAFLLLTGTILFLIFSATPAGALLASLLSLVSGILKGGLNFITGLPLAVAEIHTFDLSDTIALYALIGFLTMFLFYKELNYLRITFCISVIICISAFIKQDPSGIITAYHLNNRTALGFSTPDETVIFTPEPVADKDLEYSILPSANKYSDQVVITDTGSNAQKLCYKQVDQNFAVIIWKGKKTGIVSGVPDINLRIPKLDLVIIRNIWLTREIISQFEGSKIIADGTAKVPGSLRKKIYSTYNNGAYQLKF